MFEDLFYSLPALLLAGAAQCWLLTSIARVVAPLLQIVDKPDGKRKVHTESTPLMGGVAIYLTFLIVSLEVWIVQPGWLTVDQRTLEHAPMLFLSGGMFCALGLWDDKYGMRPLHKFIGQIVASLPFVLFGISIDQVSGLGWVIDLGILGIPLTLFWLVACSNLINLMDGLDGLAASISLVAALTISVLAVVAKLPVVSGLNVVLVGVLTGFLMHNWNPAKIFMGDSGSLTLGFLIGAFSLESSFKTAAGLTFVPLIVLLSIPMFDTSMAILRRKLNGKGIGEADRQHFHHCLRDLGLSTRQSVLVIAGLCAMMGTAVVISVIMQYEVVALGICGAVLSLLVFYKVFGSYEFDLAIENAVTTLSLMRGWIGLLGQGNLMTRVRLGVAVRPLDTWQLLIGRIQQSNGRQIVFRCVDRSHREVGNELLRLEWGEDKTTEGNPLETGPHWKLHCRVPRERNLQTEIQVIGDHADNSERLHLDGLHQMLQSFCEHWPVNGEVSGGGLNLFDPLSVSGEPSVAPMPQVASSGESDKRVA